MGLALRELMAPCDTAINGGTRACIAIFIVASGALVVGVAPVLPTFRPDVVAELAIYK